MEIKTQEISTSLLKKKKVRLFVKRIDENHQFISGNKWYKLKYNLIEARNRSAKLLLTFGGAFSNHIAATAYLAKEYGFKSIGVIRGEEHLPLNPTLALAKEQGMMIQYVSRKDYKLKDTVNFLHNLKVQYGDFYLIPEGGSNKLAVQGAAEILDDNDTQDYICCPVGSGGTIAGIVNATNKHQKVIGFPAVKGLSVLEDKIEELLCKKNHQLINDYLFGGYAKLNTELVDFINGFHLKHSIPLDAVYTGKMMFGIMDLVNKGYFPERSRVLAIHTGGLQGNKGMNARFGYNFPTN